MPLQIHLASLALVGLIACSSTSAVRCADQSVCAPLGAICVDGTCHKPDEPGLDLGGLDFATPGTADLAPTCVDSAACTAATSPICDSTLGMCRGCVAGECATATPVCLATGTSAGACVECASDTDCAGQRKLCDLATFACVPCTGDNQCGSGICDAGRCALASDVLYVDINQTPCTGADGSKTKPYCQIGDAIATGKPFVFVAGSATFYDPIAIPKGIHPPVRVIGPGTTASPVAAIQKAGAKAIGINTLDGESSSLTIEGMVLYGGSSQSAGSYPMAIDCFTLGTGQAILNVRACTIYAPDGASAVDNGCTMSITGSALASGRYGILTAGAGSIVLRGDRFEFNKQGPLTFAGTTTYTIENNLFVGNGMIASPPTLHLGDTTTGVFRFNNLIDNVCGNAPMIDCGAGAAKLIEASLLAANGTNSSFTGSCTLSNVITPVGDPAGTPASFSYDGNYKLQPGASALACCIDKLGAGPATDYNGTARPKGAGWDIGAHEVQ